jgi:hypothetical protein
MKLLTLYSLIDANKNDFKKAFSESLKWRGIARKKLIVYPLLLTVRKQAYRCQLVFCLLYQKWSSQWDRTNKQEAQGR